MAEIPVHKKSSKAWLWLLLLLIAVALLIWWLFAANDDDDVETMATDDDAYATAEPLPATAPGDADQGTALTSLDELSGGAALVGRTVDLRGVRVNREVGDAAFTIGEGANETLVTFEEQRTPNTAVEGRFDIDPGSIVNVRGPIVSYEADQSVNVTEDIDADTAIYIRAESVEMVR